MPVGDEDSELGDFLEDNRELSPQEAAAVKQLPEAIVASIPMLPDREAFLLPYRYGLIDGQAHSLEEVGKKIGVTRERVRQLKTKALNRIRYSSHKRKLQDFYE